MYKRHWGAYGKTPSDEATPAYDPAKPPSTQFGNPVHCVRFSKDNLVYNWGESDARVRPFIFGGLGWTRYSFGDLLVGRPSTAPITSIDSENRFSSTWGGGVKFYFLPNVGARVAVRFTPTLVESDPAGLWCDPFYGCWQLVDNDYSNQFETSGGITVRF